MLLSLLAACAGTPGGPQTGVPVAQETAHYRAHARTYYAPPGPPDDPWGPYITEASKRFDVPDTWIRAVIQRESSGQQFMSGGTLTTSPVGAMGLMQLMPPTYDDMRVQYSLGDDAYEPHDNIMAGTAYLRQLYDIYGSPGFLAAYNTGPGRLNDFLTRNRPLPHETRQYVAIIGPQIAGIYPTNRSQADMMVASHSANGGMRYAAVQTHEETRAVRLAWTKRRTLDEGADQPVQVAEAPAAGPPAPAPNYSRAWTPAAAPAPVQVASAAPSSEGTQSVRDAWAKRVAAAPAAAPMAAPAEAPAAAPVAVAEASPAPETQLAVQPASTEIAASALPTPDRHLRFRLIHSAMAEPAPLLRDAGHAGHWAIQVGAFSSAAQASEAAGAAQSRSPTLAHARAEVAGVREGRGAHLFRARLTGLSRSDAVAACERLSRGHAGCMVVSPDAQS